MVETIGYETIKNIILHITDKRLQALISFQYASAARLGELIRYKHWPRAIWINDFRVVNPERVITQGILRNRVYVQPDRISWIMPNFKHIKNVKFRFKEPFVYVEEKWLYDILKEWVEDCTTENIFNLKISQTRKIITEVLKPYSTHVLRRSRVTHLVDICDMNAFDAMAILGHSKLDTAVYYVGAIGRERKQRNGFASYFSKEALNEKEKKKQEAVIHNNGGDRSGSEKGIQEDDKEETKEEGSKEGSQGN
jgi:integrase